MESPLFCYTVKKVAAIEAAWIAEQDISIETLMEQAGSAAGNAMTERWPTAKKILIFCGKGNNAGDGLVLAAWAHKRGLQVQVVTTVTHDQYHSVVAAVYQRCCDQGIIFIPYGDFVAQDSPDVVVDALLGTGFHGDIQPLYEQVIACMNTLHCPVLSIDIPSGLSADTGWGQHVVKASMTVTMMVPKPGLYTGIAPEYCGDIVIKSLGMTDGFLQSFSGDAIIASDASLIKALPRRRRVAHKGDFGHVLIVGGNVGMAGASILAGLAAQKVGAGLVSVLTHPAHASAVNAAHPALMCHAFDEYAGEHIERAKVVVVGPGLGLEEWSKQVISQVLQHHQSWVVDADALKLLVGQNVKRDNWILTPHVGEAAALLGQDNGTINRDRFLAVKSIAQQYGGCCILKGAGSLIYQASDQACYLEDHGNPGMAVAGMGDVLAGTVAGLLAQGLSHLVSAVLAVRLHAKAGDLAAHTCGERGINPMDLLPLLQQLINQV